MPRGGLALGGRGSVQTPRLWGGAGPRLGLGQAPGSERSCAFRVIPSIRLGWETGLASEHWGAADVLLKASLGDAFLPQLPGAAPAHHVQNVSVFPLLEAEPGCWLPSSVQLQGPCEGPPYCLLLPLRCSHVVCPRTLSAWVPRGCLLSRP